MSTVNGATRSPSSEPDSSRRTRNRAAVTESTSTSPSKTAVAAGGAAQPVGTIMSGPRAGGRMIAPCGPDWGASGRATVVYGPAIDDDGSAGTVDSGGAEEAKPSAGTNATRPAVTITGTQRARMAVHASERLLRRAVSHR